MRRKLIIAGLVGVVVMAAGYIGGGYVVYDTLTRLSRKHCDKWQDNTPTNFVADLADQNVEVDETPYLMPNYQTVQFPSRDPDDITLDAWYVPGKDVAPTLIIVHGLDSCKRSPSPLLVAGMLHNAGYNTLLMDMRDHGDSEVEDNRYDAGTVEYRDVLGAWDWLVNEQNVPEDQIGLAGLSLGSAAALIAMGEEPRIEAIWVDSPYADLNDAITAELKRMSLPVFLKNAGIKVGQIVGGIDVTSRSPIQAIDHLNSRPIFITHGEQDERLSVEFAYQLEKAIIDNGSEVGFWIVEGSGHIMALFEHTEIYAQRLVTFFDEVFQR